MMENRLEVRQTWLQRQKLKSLYYNQLRQSFDDKAFQLFQQIQQSFVAKYMISTCSSTARQFRLDSKKYIDQYDFGLQQKYHDLQFIGLGHLGKFFKDAFRFVLDLLGFAIQRWENRQQEINDLIQRSKRLSKAQRREQQIIQLNRLSMQALLQNSNKQAKKQQIRKQIKKSIQIENKFLDDMDSDSKEFNRLLLQSLQSKAMLQLKHYSSKTQQTLNEALKLTQSKTFTMQGITVSQTPSINGDKLVFQQLKNDIEQYWRGVLQKKMPQACLSTARSILSRILKPKRCFNVGLQTDSLDDHQYITTLRQHCIQLRAQNSKLKLQIQEKQTQVHQYAIQRKNSTLKIGKLLSDIGKFQAQIAQLNKESTTYKLKHFSSMAQLENINKILQEKQSKLISMSLIPSQQPIHQSVHTQFINNSTMTQLTIADIYKLQQLDSTKCQSNQFQQLRRKQKYQAGKIEIVRQKQSKEYENMQNETKKQQIYSMGNVIHQKQYDQPLTIISNSISSLKNQQQDQKNYSVNQIMQQIIQQQREQEYQFFNRSNAKKVLPFKKQKSRNQVRFNNQKTVETRVEDRQKIKKTNLVRKESKLQKKPSRKVVKLQPVSLQKKFIRKNQRCNTLRLQPNVNFSQRLIQFDRELKIQNVEDKVIKINKSTQIQKSSYSVVQQLCQIVFPAQFFRKKTCDQQAQVQVQFLVAYRQKSQPLTIMLSFSQTVDNSCEQSYRGGVKNKFSQSNITHQPEQQQYGKLQIIEQMEHSCDNSRDTSRQSRLARHSAPRYLSQRPKLQNLQIKQEIDEYFVSRKECLYKNSQQKINARRQHPISLKHVSNWEGSSKQLDTQPMLAPRNSLTSLYRSDIYQSLPSTLPIKKRNKLCSPTQSLTKLQSSFINLPQVQPNGAIVQPNKIKHNKKTTQTVVFNAQDLALFGGLQGAYKYQQKRLILLQDNLDKDKLADKLYQHLKKLRLSKFSLYLAVVGLLRFPYQYCVRRVAVNIQESLELKEVQLFLKHVKEKHKNCGDQCAHLSQFLVKVGYYILGNVRQ